MVFTRNIKHANEPAGFGKHLVLSHYDTTPNRALMTCSARDVTHSSLCEHLLLPDSYELLSFPGVAKDDDYFGPLFPVEITSFRV